MPKQIEVKLTGDELSWLMSGLRNTNHYMLDQLYKEKDEKLKQSMAAHMDELRKLEKRLSRKKKALTGLAY